MKGCGWMTYHLTVHTIIMPTSRKTNKLTSMCLTRSHREKETDRQTDKDRDREIETETDEREHEGERRER